MHREVVRGGGAVAKAERRLLGDGCDDGEALQLRRGEAFDLDDAVQRPARGFGPRAAAAKERRTVGFADLEGTLAGFGALPIDLDRYAGPPGAVCGDVDVAAGE